MNAVIFDMDGLMFDTGKVFALAWDYAGEKTGIGKAGYMLRKTQGMGFTAARELWGDEFGNSYDEEGMRRHTREFLLKYYAANRVPAKEGLYILLNYLRNKGSRLAVASSSPGWEVENHLRKAGIWDYFQVIVCGEMVKHSKPAPDIYIKACELLREEPENCFALEDSRNGILSACGAGCKTVMVPDLWQPDEATENMLFGRFANLEEVKLYLERTGILG